VSTLSTIPDLGLPHVHRGKVRDLFDAGEGRLVMVASDRLSAFDVVMAEPVPDKGRVLTAMSVTWFEELADIMGNHLISADVADLPASAQLPELEGRVMLCRTARMLPIECIVRGFVTGSAWKEYRRVGTIHGMAVPPAWSSRPVAGADVHPLDQGGGGRPRREHRLRPGGRAGGRGPGRACP
jgi:phosphoribosylaminoimidazole-succinocarboxamide synthase